MGSWAVVAGASYGIGAEYARELAKRGLNVLIIGHDEAGLKSVEASIKQKYSVKVKAKIFIVNKKRKDAGAGATRKKVCNS